MKNININLGNTIPDEIRIEVYVEAKECVNEMIEGTFTRFIKDDKNRYLGLCLLLPCILWGLDSYLDDSPNGIDWNYDNTVISFPELSGWIGKINEASGQSNKNKIRLACIENAIKQLSR